MDFGISRRFSAGYAELLENLLDLALGRFIDFQRKRLAIVRDGAPVLTDDPESVGPVPEKQRIVRTEPERLVCSRCNFVYYIDPKVAVGTIIKDDRGRIVLVRRAIEPGYGKWVFPGGFIDRGETVEAAAVREAREECGLDIRLDRLINIYSYPGVAVIIIAFAATAIGGCLACDDESLEAQLFA